MIFFEKKLALMLTRNKNNQATTLTVLFHDEYLDVSRSLLFSITFCKTALICRYNLSGFYTLVICPGLAI